MTSLSTLCVGI
ncbi:hypothetical protein CGLO_11824 [Colletotrichum gloeosporioides Cg-14]|uniref:Uncharacterized protein n=1 Tax=Colletotrichum gloeosporioides (strain Cg-14) TaxID=1237896 RepID=T0LKW6_COLGC|nr:hypothetical protein CGLO_11824 [Colletotrichum gloeosporioides Cg-14]